MAALEICPPPALRDIATGLRFPEGPVALPDGSLLVVEIAAGRLTRIGAGGRLDIVASMGGGPNGAAMGPDGHCYVCNNGGFAWHEDATGLRPIGVAPDYAGGRIERVERATGRVETLYERTAEGRKLNSPNDLVFDRHGGFWFTDRGKTRPRDMDRGGIYYARCDGSLIREVIHPFMTPNGIALSPREDLLYVAETIGGRVWAYPVTAPGEVALLPWPSPNGGRLLAGIGGYRPFDSMAVDSAGNVCVATLSEGGIAVIAPDGGRLRHLPIDDGFTTNICFGGPGMRTAYATLSQSGRLAAFDWFCPGWPPNFSGLTAG